MYLFLVLILVGGVVGLSGCTSSTNNTTTPTYSAPIKTVSDDGINGFNTIVKTIKAQ